MSETVTPQEQQTAQTPIAEETIVPPTPPTPPTPITPPTPKTVVKVSLLKKIINFINGLKDNALLYVLLLNIICSVIYLMLCISSNIKHNKEVKQIETYTATKLDPWIDSSNSQNVEIVSAINKLVESVNSQSTAIIDQNAKIDRLIELQTSQSNKHSQVATAKVVTPQTDKATKDKKEDVVKKEEEKSHWYNPFSW